MHLLERDAELEAILTCASTAAEGIGRVVAICGEAGAGKTALLNTALVTFRDQGLPVLATRCFRDDAGTPFAALHRMIATAPDIASALPEPFGSTGLQANDEAALRQEVVKALMTYGARRPVVVAIDDLQWIDGQTAAVARSLAHYCSAAPLLLLCTVLEQSQAGDDVDQFISTFITESSARVIVPKPLSAKGIAAIVHRASGSLDGSTQAELATEIHRLSGGNPFFASELAALISDPSLRANGGISTPLPPSVRHALGARLGTLSAATRTLLEYAALFPRGISQESIDAIVAGLGEHDQNSLSEALEGGFLQSSQEFGLQFRHEIIRRHLTERQSRSTARKLHADVLAVMRDIPGVDPADLAYHAERAEQYREAVDLFEKAGHRAIRFFALDEAARYFEQASASVDRANLGDQVRDRVRLALAGSLILIDPERADQEISDVIERALARDDRLTLARARQRRAIIIYQSGQVENVLPLLDQAIPVLEEYGEEEALAEGFAYVGYCGSVLNDYALVLRATARLEDLSSALDNPMYRGIALNLRSVAVVARGEELEAAPQFGRDSVSITSAIGRIDLATAFAAVTFSSVDYWCNLDHPDQVDELVQRAGALARRSWDVEEFPGSMRMLWQLGWSFLRGDWERVRSALPALEHVRGAPIPQVYKDTVHNITAELALASAERDRALDILNYVARSPDTLNGRHSYRQWLLSVEQIIRVHIERHEVERARRWIETLDRALETQPYLPGEHLLEFCRARLALATLDQAAARAILTDLISGTSRVNNWIVLIRALSLQAEVLGHSSEAGPAVQHAERAIRGAVQCVLPFEEAQARLARATLRPGPFLGADVCIDDIHEAIAIGERLGAASLVARAEKLQSDLLNTGRPGGITRRELDVLALIVEGRTDNEIADRLFISPRTVGTHISNMLNKTTTNNRVELATWAIANDVVTPDRRRR